ncbi:MAG: phosphoribosyltransferase, partial [Nitrosopumilaceae archaeon]|nr:phosphoribosyltransferase [Nitrosopumilaceae archaeon]
MNQKEYVDWNTIESLADVLTRKIKSLHLQFNSISTISRGGLVPARLLADRLGIKVILVDKDEIPQDSLFVDDIYDTGKTFAKILPKAKDSDHLIYA